MDTTISRILGEDARELGAEVEPEPENQLQQEEPELHRPEETHIEELAVLWTTGNKNDVARRFLEMDNEESVKLVYAIGFEGALELARMVDLMPEELEVEPEEEETTEPELVEPPVEQVETA